MRRTLLLAVILAACEGAGTQVSPDLITAEQFVAVYVDLRVATFRSETGELPPEERDRVLGEHGVTQTDLLSFVEARGADAPFMRGVWDSVEVAYQRLREAERPPRPAAADTTER